MLNWFKKSTYSNFLTVDIHSHLLPGLDDGVKSVEESISILQGLHSLGYKKVITTPHIMTDYYPNTPSSIDQSLNKLKEEISKNNLDISIEAGAEYFVDEHFLKLIQQDEDLATFGENFILIETGFLNKPIFLDQVIFDLISKKYKPVLAHPERYIYLQENYKLAHELKSRGLLFQINTLSLNAYYSKEGKKLAAYLIDNKMVDFVGSDVHNQKHYQAFSSIVRSKIFQQCRQLQLLNNALL